MTHKEKMEIRKAKCAGRVSTYPYIYKLRRGAELREMRKRKVNFHGKTQR